MPPTLPVAGPSARAPRVSNFLSDDDDDLPDEEALPSLPLANGRKQQTKTKTKTKQTQNQKRKLESGVNGAPGKKKKAAKGVVGAGKETPEAQRKREEVASELLVKRYELPFYQGRRMILDEILKHETVVIIGETGCGKSTQLGQLLRRHSLSLGHYGPEGPRVAITQPRRLPTVSLAGRVAAEMGVAVGGEVGYVVRFEDVTGWETRLRFMTEGVLMRELANAEGSGRGKGKEVEGTKEGEANGNGRGGKAAEVGGEEGEDEGEDEVEVEDEDASLNLLLRYDVVVIDEAHERTLNTDFLLGSMKKIQRIRKAKAAAGEPVRELKIVIMSATLDPAKFTSFFDGCPALHVPGRMFEVKTAHAKEPADDFIEAAADSAMMIHNRSPSPKGEMLVFMPGSDEIENLVHLLRRRASDLKPDAMQLQVLPLYAALPPSAQSKIFEALPPNTRRIVVATNIAETSLTIPGIAFVIDSGYKKEKEYIYRSSGAIEHLRKMPISQASAWQRTGRAGREMPGECLRLYTEKAFTAMDAFDTPEIQRCNLASAVLQLIAMRQDPFAFEYIDPPSRDSVAAAFRTLAGLGAISSPTEITPLGRKMLRYPLDPEHARILMAAYEYGCASEIIDILSLAVSGAVFLDRAQDARETAAAARAKFHHRDGDHLTAMNVFRAYLALREQRAADKATDKGGIGAWCRDNHVNGKTLTQAVKVRQQLRELAERFGDDWRASCDGETGVVGRALLQGLFMNTAVIQADGTYRQTAGSLQVKIHPSSVLQGKKHAAIVYDELTITSAIYARNVSSFEQNWLTEVPWFQKAGQSLATPVARTKV